MVIGRKKEVINKMLDFVEGRMTVYEFWNLYMENRDFMQVVKRKEKYLYPFEDYYFKPKSINLNKLYSRVEIYWRITYFLKLNKISFNPVNLEEERLLFLKKICPDWVTISDYEWLEELLEIKDKPIKEMETIKSLKERVETLFKYENRPPIWIQEAEWPIIDGSPAIFIKQSVNPNSLKWEEEPIDYFFKDREGKEIKVTQLP